MIEYVIIGTSHLTQESGELEKAVVGAVVKHDIKMIAEENTYDIASTAPRRASRHQGISYLQVDPPPAEWAGLGIEREMGLRDRCLQREDVRLSHADDVREEIWLGKIEAAVCQGPVLVVCGYLHVDFFARKVAKRGGTVVERTAFPPEFVGRSPTMTLDPSELEEHLRKRREAGALDRGLL